MNEKKVANYCRGVSAVIFLGSIVLLFPQIQQMIVSFCEQYIVHRELQNHAKWMRLLSCLAGAGIVVATALFVFAEKIHYLLQKTYGLLQRDILGILFREWKGAPSFYTKAFLLIFAGVNLVFLFDTINFIPGNHDHVLTINGLDLFWSLLNGRWTAGIANNVFLRGQILPILTNLIGFAEYSLSAVLICYWWKLTKSLPLFVITGLLLLIQPYTLEWLYYRHDQISKISSLLCAVLVCIAGDKAALKKGIKRALCFCAALGLFLFSVGSYAPVLNTFGVLFLGRLLIDFVNSNISAKNIMTIVKTHVHGYFAVIAGCIIHYLITLFLRAKGYMGDSYMTETLHLNEIPERFIQISKDVLKNLVRYEKPFFTQDFTILFTILLVLMVIAIVLKTVYDKNEQYKTGKIVLFGIIVMLTLIATMTASFIAKERNFQAPRVDFYGLALFHVLPVVVLFSLNKNSIKTVCAVICVLLLQICIVQDLTAQKVSKFGYEAEKMLWNRIVARIEDTPGFSADKQYKLLAIGILPALQKNYYAGQNGNKGLLAVPYDGMIFNAVEFYSYHFISERYTTAYSANDSVKQTTDELILKMAPEIERAKVYPDRSSIIIKDDILMVVLDQAHLDKAREFIKAENRGG